MIPNILDTKCISETISWTLLITMLQAFTVNELLDLCLPDKLPIYCQTCSNFPDVQCVLAN